MLPPTKKDIQVPKFVKLLPFSMKPPPMKEPVMVPPKGKRGRKPKSTIPTPVIKHVKATLTSSSAAKSASIGPSVLSVSHVQPISNISLPPTSNPPIILNQREFLVDITTKLDNFLLDLVQKGTFFSFIPTFVCRFLDLVAAFASPFRVKISALLNLAKEKKLIASDVKLPHFARFFCRCMKDHSSRFGRYVVKRPPKNARNDVFWHPTKNISGGQIIRKAKSHIDPKTLLREVSERVKELKKSRENARQNAILEDDNNRSKPQDKGD